MVDDVETRWQAVQRQGLHSWLERHPKGFGCSICRGAGLHNVWSLGLAQLSVVTLKKITLDRHAASAGHVKAMEAQDIVLGKSVPPLAKFDEAKTAVEAGYVSPTALGSRLDVSECHAKRFRTSLAVAANKATLEFITSPGAVLTLHVDARQHWLAVRASGCNSSLECHTGLLTMIDMRQQNAWNASTMKSAILDGIRALAGPSYNDVLKAVEVYNADSAADEQLCGRMMMGRRLGDMLIDQETLPSIKFVHKDKAHASRRIASRGWAADPFLNQVHQSVVGAGSFIQKLQNSPLLKQAFAENIDNMNRKHVASRPRDLGACKPRFEVSQKPYLRRTLHYEALLATAAAAARKGVKVASVFLEEETTERALQAAMLADGGEECLRLTRLFDQEDFDSSSLPDTFADHLARLKVHRPSHNRYAFRICQQM